MDPFRKYAAAALAMLLLLAPWLAPPVVWAAIITPGISVGVGYDDNVRLQRSPRSDYFAFVRPQLEIKAGRPSSELRMNMSLDYSQYLHLSEYDRVESAKAQVLYHHEFTKVTTLDVFDGYSMSYDPLETTDDGGYLRVEDSERRRTSNTAGVRLAHRYDPFSHIIGEYDFDYRDGSEDEDNEVYINRGRFDWLHALNAKHQLGLAGGVRHEDWETSPNLDEYRLDATYYWLPNKRVTYYVAGGGRVTRADDSDSEVATSRDYDLYTVGAGYIHKWSPLLKWELGLGWSYVDGDAKTNAAAGSGFPVVNASIMYTGRRHDFEAHARATMDEYDIVGANTGLTRTQTVGGFWRWRVRRHWTLLVYGDYVRDDYQQDETAAGTSYAKGVVETTRVGTRLDWALGRNSTLVLDYRFLNRDAENDDDDRQQNRVLLYLTHKWPMLW